MTEGNNILLISDDENIKKLVFRKLILLRHNDKIEDCGYSYYKKIVDNNEFDVVIIQIEENTAETIKKIEYIKNTKSSPEVILLTNMLISPNFLLEAYDKGIFDHININDYEPDFLIKIVNCFKAKSLKKKLILQQTLLDSFGLTDEKYNMYKIKNFEEIYDEISQFLYIKNGAFAAIRINDDVKTKVSTSRLANILKTLCRKNDILFSGQKGTFYIIFASSDINGAKSYIQKIQNEIGTIKVHSGICLISKNTAEELLNNVNDSLKVAIDTNELCISLTEHLESDSWLEDDNISRKKHYKLFNNIYEKIRENIISPLFFRYEKDCLSKLKKTKVIQYVNEVEGVFSLKQKDLSSELTLHYDGNTKILAEISHSGLYSPENSKFEYNLNQFNEKVLNRLLKQICHEFKIYTKDKDKNA